MAGSGLLCKHSRIEVFEDEDRPGFYFAECSICETQSPLAPSASKARSALRTIESERPDRHGGSREGAGRKATLPEEPKTITVMLLPSHLKQLAGFSKREKINSRSEAVRRILDRHFSE